MEEPSSSLSAADSKKWILRIILALVVGQAIWALVVALTSHLLVPLTARVMGGDPNSPLYLGKGDIDVPALFIAVVEFCLAGIVAVVMNSWVQKPVRTVVRKAASVGSLSLQSAVPSAPPAAPRAQASVPTAPIPAVQAKPPQTVTAPVTPPVAATVATKPAPPAAPPKPEKPKAPKEVYYNIVGDPITMDDE